VFSRFFLQIAHSKVKNNQKFSTAHRQTHLNWTKSYVFFFSEIKRKTQMMESVTERAVGGSREGFRGAPANYSARSVLSSVPLQLAVKSGSVRLLSADIWRVSLCPLMSTALELTIMSSRKSAALISCSS
jgi:hypothetical protein